MFSVFAIAALGYILGRITIKGVNLGSGKPGEWSTDFSIDKGTYLRWFANMQEMGANVVRVYTV